MPMIIRLRSTLEHDLDFVLGAEQNPENSPFITVWTREQHRAALTAKDLSHLIVENTADSSRVGYIILAGMAEARDGIELRRIVVTEKGKGVGKEALRLIKRLAFDDLKADRLWLDVKEHNARARHVYEAEGFVAEGVAPASNSESLVIMSVLRGQYYKTTSCAG